MRVIRSLILCLGVAVAAAGCARQQPVMYVAYPSAAAPAGIDNVVYGTPNLPMSAGPYAAAPYAAGPYRAAPYAAPPSAPVQYATAPVARGLYGSAPMAAPSGAGLYAYAPPAPEAQYTLDSGDRLRIVVFGQDGLTNSYLVGASGSIDMPLIGSVVARGATTDQLASRIAEKLRAGFIREPHVAVEIEGYRPFFILGEVTQPGQYPYVANMTAETAVAIAGGFTPRALRISVILNRNFAGRQIRMSVPLTFPLRPGDTVNVQERWF
jgi:polysaccharide biosynthesis/export protein